jgi:BirA family biotin operon repressor/biotin-[acetyl-CoA-carboxylase] ligase
VTGFDTARFGASLTTERLGRSLVALAETDSTMDDARAAADNGAPEGHVIVADQQRLGRGSHGRVWSSPAGGDLYFSVVLRPALSLADLPPLTLAVGLAVADTVRGVAPNALVRIKWPNDVFLEGKKCAGVLVETRSVGLDPAAVIVGIGINVNRLEFDAELARESTSIALVTGQPVDRERLLAKLLEELERQVTRFVAHGAALVVSSVEEHLLYRGQRIAIDELRGTLRGVDPDGALRLQVDTGDTVRVLSGRMRLDDA